MKNARTQKRLGERSQLGFAAAVVCAAIALLSITANRSGAQVTYSVTSAGVYAGFNNSMGSETEDDFVANSFTVVAGGTHLTDVVYMPTPGQVQANQSATVAIYTGSSLTNPSADGGLSRIIASTTSVTLASGQSS